MWQTDMVTILRAMIDDMDAKRYSDVTLVKLLVVAAFQVLTEFDFDYTVDISAQSISPDPTLPGSRSDSFTNFVCMKAACVIDRGAAIVAAGRAIAVRDGGSSVDLRGVFQGKLEILKNGWCAVYENTKFEYALNRAGEAGAIIMTPFRLYAREQTSGYMERR